METEEKHPERRRRGRPRVRLLLIIAIVLCGCAALFYFSGFGAGFGFGMGVGLGNGAEGTSAAVQAADSKAAPKSTAAPIQEADSNRIIITVAGQDILYGNETVSLDELHNRLLQDYSEGKEIVLRDREAINASFESVRKLLNDMDLPISAIEERAA